MTHFWRHLSRRLRAQAGATLIEAMVGMALLLVGLLGTFQLVDAASAGNSKAKAREGATNTARELLESARDVSYTQIGQAGWFQSELQGVSGGSGTVSNPNSYSQQTTVTRRGITYTVTVSWCSVDDSKDGYGTHGASIRWCTDSSSTGTSDGSPEDLKRVTTTVNYSLKGVAQPAVVQTTTVGPAGLSVGPQLTDFQVTQPTVSSQTAPVISTAPPGNNCQILRRTLVKDCMPSLLLRRTTGR